jgi:hypothetical protein
MFRTSGHRRLRVGDRQMNRVGAVLNRLALRLVPETRWGDNLLSFVNFVRIHRRLPSNRPLFNDVLYKIKTSNEIIDPLRVFVTDKEFVKLYVKATVGDQFNVPTLTVLRSMDEVRRYGFPADCCIKPTHLSGKVILRSSDGNVDLEEIQAWFASSHYRETREANYRTLKPKVIVEPLIFGSTNVSDFKIFCYAGKAKLVQVDLDRHSNHTRKFFDTNWNEMPFSCLYPRSPHPVEKPGNLDSMLAIASALSMPFGFVRIDLYSDGQACVVGEITNCHENATGRFIPVSGEILASRLTFESRQSGVDER